MLYSRMWRIFTITLLLFLVLYLICCSLLSHSGDDFIKDNSTSMISQCDDNIFKLNSELDRFEDDSLCERITREMEAQEDEDLRDAYKNQYRSVSQMNQYYQAGMTEKELALQNDMESANLDGKSQVYYEDIFSKYFGLEKDKAIENRIAYRNYLIEHRFDLVSKLDAGYSILRMISGYLPILMPLVVLSVCIIITMLLHDESSIGTAKISLISPHKRWEIILSKYIVSLVFGIFLVFLFMVMLILPFFFQKSEGPMDYPVQINFATSGSFLIGNLNFITAGNFFKLCLLSLPITIVFYLSVFTFRL